MKKTLFCLFLLCAFVSAGQAQSVDAKAPSENVPVQAEEQIVPADAEKVNPDGLDEDIREEFTSRLKRRYRTMSLKELEKRKKYVEKQIGRKTNSKNVALKEKLDIELEVVNDAIEQAKHPTAQDAQE